jgi:hypothetical protein
MRLWDLSKLLMITRSICTILAFTRVSAWQTSIKALAILLLALAFFAVATFYICLLTRTWCLNFESHSCLFQRLQVIVIVTAAIACTIFGAHFARREALAVHLEAFCLFTSTSSFLFFDCWGRCDCFLMIVKLYIQW